MRTQDQNQREVLARFAMARNSRQLGESLGFWMESGALGALVLWVRDRPAAPLRATWHRGIVADDATWSAYARAEASPIRLAVETGTPQTADPAAPPLASSGLSHWTAIALDDVDGSRVGVALVGRQEPGQAPGSEVVLRVLGPALSRVLEAERNAVRAGLFDHLTELTADGVIVATPDGDYLAYNPALENLSGWSETEIRRHGWTHLAYPDPAVRRELQRGIAALVRGAPSEGIVRSIRCSDGTDIQARIWSRLQPHPSGAAPAMLGVIRDVTNESIGRRKAIWEESHTQIGRLAGGIAHEFNNLLAAILGHAELIAAHAEEGSAIESSAETIVQSAERGSGLSSQLLAFSGSRNLRLQPVDIRRLVHDATRLFAPRLPDAVSLRVVDTGGESTLFVEGDASQLQQVLVNLLTNAVDAMSDHDGDGQITVTVDSQPMPENVRYRAPGAPDPTAEVVRVRVHDQGPGFSEDALAHLFVPFFSGKAHGHGLGLAAVRGLMASHTGAIDVHNDEEDGGGIVDLYLLPSLRPELTLPTPPEDSAGHERIWVVDDQPAILEFTQISLTSQGYAVRVFATLEAVMTAISDLEHGLSSATPAVVVLDVVMPDGGGPVVREALRRAGIDVPILWTSGHAPEHVTLPEADGAFLQKPFHGADLAAAIRRLL